MRAAKTRVSDAAVLIFALALPSCSLMPKKAGPAWIEKPSEESAQDAVPDKQDKNDDAATGDSDNKTDASPDKSETDTEEAPDDENFDEAKILKAVLPEAENTADRVRVFLVSRRLHELEPKEEHWENVRQEAEKALGDKSDPVSMEASLKERLLKVQKERRGIEQGRRKDQGEGKLLSQKKSLTEELNRHEGRALSASVHVTVVDEERGRLTAKLENEKSPDLLSQLKKANENKDHWQKIVATEKSEVERVQGRLTELSTLLKGREQDLKDIDEAVGSAREEEGALKRDLKLIRGWKDEFNRRQKEALKAQRKEEKKEEVMTPPPEKSQPIETPPPPVAEAPVVEKKVPTPDEITLESFDPAASVDEILAKFPDPSHQRAALNLLLWKMTSNDPRRADVMNRITALRGKGALASMRPVEIETARQMPKTETAQPFDELSSVGKKIEMVPAPVPEREEILVPKSARQRLLSGSEKTSIPANEFPPASKTKEKVVVKPMVVPAEKNSRSGENKSVRPAARDRDRSLSEKESSAHALEKLLQEPPPESWQVEPQIEEKISAPASARPAKKETETHSRTGAMVYLVKTGDTLPSLAKEMYGDPARWQEIYEANQNVILRGLLEPGQWLLIPQGMAR